MTSTTMCLALCALVTVGCGGVPSVGVAEVRPEIESHVNGLSWNEYTGEGPSGCVGTCDACIARDRAESVLIAAGWMRQECAADGHVVVAAVPEHRSELVGRGHVAISSGGRVADIVVLEEQREVEAPAIPFARIRVTWHPRLTPIGQRLRRDLRCGANGAPAICARLAETQELEFGATYSRSSGWIARPATPPRSHGAGGLYWN